MSQLRLDEHFCPLIVLRFVASGWRNRPASPPSFSTASIQKDYEARLERISNNLPQSYKPLLDSLKTKLPSLFVDEYSMVLNHDDLLENNIHVDVRTGHITGIVDWHNAGPGLFAVQLWGLENILGIRRMTDMGFHPRHMELRRIFWRAFYEEIGDVSETGREKIRTARMVGIFLANGDLAHSSDAEREMGLAVLQSMTLGLLDVGQM